MRNYLLPLLLAGLPVFAGVHDQLPNVIVSATRSEQTSQLTPGHITIITREQILRSGAKYLADVLRSIAQIQDNYGDGGRATVDLRGFGATAGSNTLLLIDGRRVNNSDIAPPDLSSVSLKDVVRIEVIRGSAGVLFGDQAVGGVINVITIPEKHASPEPDSLISLRAGVSSFSGRDLEATLAKSFENGVDIRFSGERRGADGYRDHNRLDLTNLRADFRYRGDAGKLFLELQRVKEDLDLPGAITRDQMETDRKLSQNGVDFVVTETDMLRIGTTIEFGANWKLLAELTHRDSDANGKLSGGVPFQQDRLMRSINPRMVGEYDNVLITVGADLEYNEYELETDFFGFIATTNTDQRVTNYFLQLIYPLQSSSSSGALTSVLGFRHASFDNDIEDTFSFPAGTDFSDSINIFEAGVTFEVSDRLRLFLRRDENFRFPKIDELTFTGFNVGKLKTQSGVSWEAGFDHHTERLTTKLSVYDLRLENEIGFDPLVDVGFGFFGANNNLDDTERLGLTIDVQWALRPDLTIRARYDRISSQFTDGPFEDKDIPYVSDQLASLRLTHDFHDNIQLFAEAQYAGSRYADGDFLNNRGKQGGYTIYNANIRYISGDWSASLRIKNIGDKRTSEYVVLRFDGVKTFYPSPTRHYALTLRYKF